MKGLCRASPAAALNAANVTNGGVGAAASAGAEAGPHPTSPASGRGGFRRLSAWVPINDLWYNGPPPPAASELAHEAELGAVALIVERLGVGLALFVDEGEARAEAEDGDGAIVDR